MSKKGIMSWEDIIKLDKLAKEKMVKPIKIKRREYYFFETTILNYLNTCLLYHLFKEKVL